MHSAKSGIHNHTRDIDRITVTWPFACVCYYWMLLEKSRNLFCLESDCRVVHSSVHWCCC